MTGAFLTGSYENGVVWAKFWETVQSMCVMTQLEPTVKGTVEPGVMGEVRSQWLESMSYQLQNIYTSPLCKCFPLSREGKCKGPCPYIKGSENCCSQLLSVY